MNCPLRIFLVGIGLVWSTVVYCQIRPVLNTGYSGLLGYFTNHGYQFQEFQIGIGNRFNERLSVHLNYKYIWYAYYKTNAPNDERMKSGLISLSVGYRFLKEERLFSPMIMLDMGVPLHSNADSTFMHGYTIIPNYDLGSWRYNRGLLFGKLKALCDIHLQSFNLQFGVSYNHWYYSASGLRPSYYTQNSQDYVVVSTSVNNIANFGLEAGLMYTIPTKREKKE